MIWHAGGAVAAFPPCGSGSTPWATRHVRSNWRACGPGSSPHAREIRDIPPVRSVNLLPGFDQYVVVASWHARHLLPGDLRSRVYRPQGWISPVLLVNGRIGGRLASPDKGQPCRSGHRAIRQAPVWVRRAAARKPSGWLHSLVATCGWSGRSEPPQNPLASRCTICHSTLMIPVPPDVRARRRTLRAGGLRREKGRDLRSDAARRPFSLRARLEHGLQDQSRTRRTKPSPNSWPKG